MNIELQTLIILASLVASVAFQSGITWTIIRQVRKDVNGFKDWIHSHEAWSHTQVKEISDRVSRIEGKADAQ